MPQDDTDKMLPIRSQEAFAAFLARGGQVLSNTVAQVVLYKLYLVDDKDKGRELSRT